MSFSLEQADRVGRHPLFGPRKAHPLLGGGLYADLGYVYRQRPGDPLPHPGEVGLELGGLGDDNRVHIDGMPALFPQIGRASCRERV